MRTTADRIRHALIFEVFGLLLITPLASLATGHGLGEIGVIAVVASLVAMVWNYIYNLAFDRSMVRLRGSVAKTVPIRILHAVLFEAGLLIAVLPFIAWYLQISLLEALIMDIGIALFYLVYAYVYNWAYDRVFPIPALAGAAKQA